MKTIGLRVDADTFYGTRDGVPPLLELFAKYDIRATFFFCAGPDTMGRHLWRLFRPAFLFKILRSNAPSLYGLKILLAGTAWPGRRILPALGATVQACAEAGHEVGLHGWNHQSWQANMPCWSERRLEREIRQGLEALESVLSRRVECSAVPGWLADERVLAVKEAFAFRYNSDCRGSHPFRPLLPGDRVGTAQIPVTLPTFDEVVGSVVAESGYNDYILQAMQQALTMKEGTKEEAPVYTIHAEVEGLSRRALFEDFLCKAAQRRFVFSPLGALLPYDLSALPRGRVECLPFPGREGCLGRQIETQ